MNAFNRALPYPKDESDKLLLNIIGNKNVELVEKAVYALETGDLKLFGNCLNEAQKLYAAAKDACPEYKMPIFYSVISDSSIQKLSFGGKSVGSGGDGSLLLICKDENSQKSLKNYIKEKYQMDSIEFCINGENG